MNGLRKTLSATDEEEEEEEEEEEGLFKANAEEQEQEQEPAREQEEEGLFRANTVRRRSNKKGKAASPTSNTHHCGTSSSHAAFVF